MSRIVTIATVQPPAVPLDASRSITDCAMELLEQAARHNCDIICLPEYLNCTELVCGAPTGCAGDPALLDAIRAIAAARGTYVIAPLIVAEGTRRYNRAVVIDRRGRIIGHHDKVHLTQNEREDLGLTAGQTWPTFDCDFGRIGVMVCYDGCFFESSRLLCLNGAQVIFWPTLQRSYTESELDIQTRAHAVFNHVVVVRSSYGWPTTHAWKPGNMVGMSCVCHPDGNYLASLGKLAGWTMARVDLDAPMLGARSHGGQVGDVRQMRLQDRMPHTYRDLCRDAVQPAPAEIHITGANRVLREAGGPAGTT